MHREGQERQTVTREPGNLPESLHLNAGRGAPATPDSSLPSKLRRVACPA